MKKNIIVLLLIIAIMLLKANQVYPSKVINWAIISGEWEIRNDNLKAYLISKNSKTREWGYSELINYNSLISLNPINIYSSFSFSFEIPEVPQGNLDILFFLNAFDYRQFNSFKLLRIQNNSYRLSFINCSIKDTTLRPAVKWNYTITELATKDIELEYNREYRAEIRVKKNLAALYIDGKKLMEAEAPEDLTGGKIGFSNRNAILKIADVKVYSGKELVFEDDFSKDSIKRFRVQATTMSKEEYEKRNKAK